LLRLVALFGVIAFVFATAAPAGAHAVVLGTKPAAGERLAQPLTEVQVRLAEPVDHRLSSMVVRGPQGRNWAAGPVEGNRNLIVQRLVVTAPPGSYTASYRIVSADGHVVVGSVRFTSTVGESNRGAGDTARQAKSARRASGAVDFSGTTHGPGRLTAGLSLAGGTVILLLLLVRVIGRHRSARNAMGP